MKQHRQGLPEMPPSIARLPTDHRGYPVPWFVADVDGKPDFRIMDHVKLQRAYRERRCWTCGERMQRFSAYVIGPMCAVNRISSEPTSHVECAMFGARACPFLTRPKAKRREANLPEVGEMAGVGLMHNPEANLVWVISGQAKTIRDPNGGTLFSIGEPERVHWFKEGREATRQEVLDAIEKGLPTLREAALAEGAKAVAHLEACIDDAQRLVPA